MGDQSALTEDRLPARETTARGAVVIERIAALRRHPGKRVRLARC